MTIRDKRIFLTGGAGFIGTALTERLVENIEVVIYDNGHRNSLKDSAICNHDNLRMIEGDVLDMEGIQRAVQGCHIVVHLAAIAGVDTVIQMPVTTMKVSLIGTYNVLEAVRHEPRSSGLSTSPQVRCSGRTPTR